MSESSTHPRFPDSDPENLELVGEIESDDWFARIARARDWHRTVAIGLHSQDGDGTWMTFTEDEARRVIALLQQALG